MASVSQVLSGFHQAAPIDLCF